VWLKREIEAVRPVVIVALGATALRALTGSALSIETARQQDLWHADGARILAAYHPSAILRAEGERAAQLRSYLKHDLRSAAQIAKTRESIVKRPTARETSRF
jgi:uracil-DNA glycosylase family 4